MQLSRNIATRFVLVMIAVAMLPDLVFGQESKRNGRFPGEQWMAFASHEEAGFSSEKMATLVDDCKASNAACVLVIYDGAVLFHFGDAETRFMCHSVRKSFMSMLFGIYVHGGAIELDRTLEELGIDDISPELTVDEKRARVVDLLSSRSGVYHRAAYEPDDMKRTRPERGKFPPGTHWWYNNWDFNTLLTIFEQETGERFFEAFRRRIAQPIGLEDFRLRDAYYHYEPEHSRHPAYPFQLSGRDMARIGLLMANGGRWGDRQIIPAKWVDVSTQPHSRIQKWNSFESYGYLWWVRQRGGEKLFSAQGSGGNSIDVLPDRKLVFVFRADTYRGKAVDWESRWRIVEKVIQSQTNRPAPSPELVALPEKNVAPEAFPLTEEYKAQFPVQLVRQLPRRLPPEIRDEPVRIELVDGILRLLVKRAPAMSFDLVPIAEDRFWISDFGEMGIIERDANSQPTRFLLKNDLLGHVRELRIEGLDELADKEATLVKELFEPLAADQ